MSLSRVESVGDVRVRGADSASGKFAAASEGPTSSVGGAEGGLANANEKTAGEGNLSL